MIRDHMIDQTLSLWTAKAAATTAAAAAVVGDDFLNGFGMPLHVLLMGTTGALLALAYTKPMPDANRYGVLFASLACAMLGAAIAVAAPHIPGVGWTQAVPAPVRSLLAAFACQFTIPLAIHELPALIARLRERIGGK